MTRDQRRPGRSEDIGAPLLPWTERPWHVSQEGALGACRHFLACYRAGARPETDGADNLATYALVDAAYEAAATGRAVTPEPLARPMTDAERLAIYGTLEQPAAPRELVAGPLSALLDGAALRQIRFGGVEVLRGIAFLMRDANWGTPPTVLSRLDVSEASDRFAVVAEGRIGPDGEALRLGLRIEGSADGRLTVDADAVPERDLVTNRTGFVVLHPLTGVVGRPMTVEHGDGTRATVAIPEAISPDQPIFDIAGARARAGRRSERRG